MSVITRDAQHVYFVDGRPVPISVTGVLDRSGVTDFSHLPPFVRDEALHRGTIVHQAIAALNDDDLDLEQFYRDFDAYAGYVQAWVSFRAQRRFVPILNEHLVYSRAYDVAGAIDCLGVLDRTAVLLDFATGHAADACKQLQTAAYEGLAREWAKEDPALAAFFAQHPYVKRYAVELRRDTTFRLQPYTAASDYREFLTLRAALGIREKYRPVRRPIAEVA